MRDFFDLFDLRYDSKGFVNNPYLKELYRQYKRKVIANFMNGNFNLDEINKDEQVIFINPRKSYEKGVIDSCVLLPELYQQLGLDTVKFTPLVLSKLHKGAFYDKSNYGKVMELDKLIDSYDDKELGLLYKEDSPVFKLLKETKSMSTLLQQSSKYDEVDDAYIHLKRFMIMNKFFENKVKKDRIKTIIMNLACNNNASFENNLYLKNNVNKTSRIFLTDFVNCGVNWAKDGKKNVSTNDKDFNISGRFENDFYLESMLRECIIDLIKDKDFSYDYFTKEDKEETFSKLSKIKVFETVKDIKEKTNYSVDKNFADYVQSSIDNFGEELTR